MTSQQDVDASGATADLHIILETCVIIHVSIIVAHKQIPLLIQQIFT